jgi:hypothetical protein
MAAKRPSAAQMQWNSLGAQHMRKDGVRRALQIVRQRGFTYDGSLAPTCLRCGGPREDRRGLKCDRCEAS